MSTLARQLGNLLESIGAKIRVDEARIVQSTLYDTNYHVAITACAFDQCADEALTGEKQIHSPLLKLIQFIALRPVLLPDILCWLEDRRQRSIESVSKMPRAFLADTTHDRVIDYLVATGVLVRSKHQLVSGPRVEFIEGVVRHVRENNLFPRERETLRSLSETRIHKVVLEGK